MKEDYEIQNLNSINLSLPINIVVCYSLGIKLPVINILKEIRKKDNNINKKFFHLFSPALQRSYRRRFSKVKVKTVFRAVTRHSRMPAVTDPACAVIYISRTHTLFFSTFSYYNQSAPSTASSLFSVRWIVTRLHQRPLLF